MNLNPQIYNFRIQPGQPQRVYFDSTKSIVAGIDAKNGMLIQGKVIIGVTIVTGLTTGHYFTLSTSLTFWNNILIRYEGSFDSDFLPVSNQSTITDDAGRPLFDFRLNYIKNNLPEPDTNINRFVTLLGNNSNDGKTEATAWRTATYGVTQINTDTTLWVKAGNYGNEGFTIPSGTSSNVIKIVGYKNTPGDGALLDRVVGMNLSNLSSELPYYDGGNNKVDCINAHNKTYIVVRNIMISNYTRVGVVLGESQHALFHNLYIDECNGGMWSNNAWDAAQQRIERCYSGNHSSQAIIVAAVEGLIDDCWAFTSKITDQDYYINIRPGRNEPEGSHSNCIINSYIQRFKDDTHTGHGFSIAANYVGDIATPYQKYTKLNLVQNCEAVNVTNSGIEFRYSGSSHNVARNVLFRAYDEYTTSEKGWKGLTYKDSTHHNVVEQCTIKHVQTGVKFVTATNDIGVMQPGGWDNRVINTHFEDMKEGVHSNASVKNDRNFFINCSWKDVDKMFVESKSSYATVPRPPADWLDDSNEFINNNFDTVVDKYDAESQCTALFKYSNFYSANSNHWSADAETGVGNISVDPNYVSGSLLPQNDAMNVGQLNDMANYDIENRQRYVGEVTIGSEQISVSSPIQQPKIEWTISDTVGVFATVIFRDELEIGRVPVGEPSIFFDPNATVGVPYKYEVQAVDINGISVTEIIGVNVKNHTV